MDSESIFHPPICVQNSILSPNLFEWDSEQSSFTHIDSSELI